MQTVRNTQRALFMHAEDFGGQIAGVFFVIRVFAAMNGANAQRVKHGCNPTHCKFRIMGQYRSFMWPIGFGARLNMAFDIVGVQFDQTGT